MNSSINKNGELAKNELSESDKKKLIDIFFYLQDARIEISSCYSLIIMSKLFLEMKEYKEYIEKTGKLVILYPTEDKPLAFTAVVRVALHNLIINIFKISELIEKNQRILKKTPNTNLKLNKFRSKYFTDDLKKYRNKYVAHHFDKKEGELVPLQQLKSYLANILSLKDFDSEIEISKIIDYVKNFYTPCENLNRNNITGIIQQFAQEIENLGIQLNRNVK